jgi:hypothetical protein
MATARKRRSPPVTAISEPLLKLLCLEDFRAGIPDGELPEDCLDFWFFDTNQRRREVYDAGLPLMTERCKQLGRPVPSFEEVLKMRGIPTGGK